MAQQSWIDTWPSDIERPLASVRPEPGQAYSNLPVSAVPTERPKPPASWNDIAAKLDPMMSQSEYDSLRQQYFATHVSPYAPPLQRGAYWEDFKSKTERPKAIDSPLLAQSKFALLSAASRSQELMQKLGDKSTVLIQQRDELGKMLHRDGISTDVPALIGNSVPDLMSFAALETATAGAGGLLAIGAEAGSIAAKASAFLRGTTFANRVARGSLMFGTQEAIMAQQGETIGHAFARGMGTGAAWEIGLAGVGKLLGGGKGISEAIRKKKASDLIKEAARPSETAEAANAVAAKPDMPIVDQAMAQHAQETQEAIRKKGLPLALKVDNREPYVRLQGVQGNKVPFTLQVKLRAEGAAVQQLQDIISKGGQLQAVLFHENGANQLIDTLTHLRSLDSDRDLKISMIKSALDQSGHPLQNWDDSMADALLTKVESRLAALEQKRSAMMTQADINTYFGNTPPSASERQIQEIESARKDANMQQKLADQALSQKAFPDDGARQVGGQTFPTFVLKDGVRGSRGVYAEVLERTEPDNPAQSALLRRPQERKSLYIAVDGTVKEWNPKEGLPSDNWTPKDLTERQGAWQLFKNYLTKAKGRGAPDTIAAQDDLRKFVQESLERDPVQRLDNAPRYVTQVPTMADLKTQLLKHETPEGLKLSLADAEATAKRIYSLWGRGFTNDVKMSNALALRGYGVEHLVPREWQEIVNKSAGSVIDEAQLLTAADNTIATGTLSKTEARETIKAYRYSDIAPLYAKGMTDEAIQAETGLTARRVQAWRQMYINGAKVAKGTPEIQAWKQFWEHPEIPASDLLQALKGSWKRRGNFIDVIVPPEYLKDKLGAQAAALTKRNMSMTVEDAQESLKSYFVGLDPTTEVAGIRLLGSGAKTRQSMEASMYHERMHIDLNTARSLMDKELFQGTYLQMKDEARETIGRIVDSFNKGQGGYQGIHALRQVEEVFTNVSAAIRTQDPNLLNYWARLDTSVEHLRYTLEDMTAVIRKQIEGLQDFQELRHLRTRLEDLQRRTGYDRFTRMYEEARTQGHSFYYDSQRRQWNFNNGRENFAVASKTFQGDTKALADWLEQRSSFVESVPSSSMAFEQMGLTGPVFDREAIVRSKGDEVNSTFMPPSADRFKGLAAVSALFTPMLSWSSKLTETFRKQGVTIPLFDRVKDVDDAIRLGMTWRDETFIEAAKHIPAQADQAKLMLPFLTSPEQAIETAERTQYKTPASFITRGMPLSRSPKLGEAEYFNGETNWTQLAKSLNVDQAFLDRVRGLQQWFDKFQADTGIQVNHYLRQDLPRLQNFNYEPSAVWPKGLDKSELNRMARAVVDGELKPQDPHIGHTVAWLIREGFETKFTEKPLRELQKLVNLKDEAGKSVLGVARYNVDNYIKYVKGIPDATQQVMFKAMGDFQKHLGTAMGEVNAKLGTKLPTEFSNPGNFWQQYMLLSYAGGIGLRPAIWFRDGIQAVTNTLPILGFEKFSVGMQSLFRKGAWEEAMKDGALLGLHNVQGLYGDIFQELAPQSGGLADKAIDVTAKMLSPSRWFHNIGRMAAYFGERDTAEPLIKQFRENKIDFGQLLDKTSMWFYDSPLQLRLQKQLLEKDTSGNFVRSHAEMAKQLALEAVDHTLWAYRRGTQPQFLRTGIGRVFGQYGLWPLSYLDFLKRMTMKMATNPRNATQAVAMWYGANKAASMAFTAAGGDVSKWFFLSPAGYAGSPHLAAAQAAGAALENSQEGREARKTLLEYPMNFIPAYLELKNVSRYISEGGHFFNDDWTLTDNAVRVLGMHPKSEPLDLTPEEELEYQAGFTHRR